MVQSKLDSLPLSGIQDSLTFLSVLCVCAHVHAQVCTCMYDRCMGMCALVFMWFSLPLHEFVEPAQVVGLCGKHFYLPVGSSLAFFGGSGEQGLMYSRLVSD